MSRAERIAALSPEKRALLATRLVERGYSPRSATDRATDTVTLSSAQRRMWALHQLDSSGRAHHVPVVLQLAGALDAARLATAICHVVDRHAVLRLVIAERDGEIVARHRNDAPILEPIAPAAAPEAAVNAFIERPFDPATGLIRAGLLARGPSDHVLALVFHHIVFDGRSIAVLLDELDRAYAAICNGESPALPPLGWSYADFADWETAMLAADEFAASRSAWLRRLDGAPSAVRFPGSTPERPPQSAATIAANFGIGRDAYEALRHFAAAERMTPFAVLLTTLAALLGRWSRVDDLVIGVVSAAAVPARFDGLIGLFVNPLPIRVEISPASTLQTLASQVRERLAEAFAHGQYPFERLVADLRQAGHRQPLFNVAMTMQSQADKPASLGDLAVTSHLGGSNRDVAAKFDLSLSLIDNGHVIVGTLEADAQLWAQLPLDRFTAAFAPLLAAALANPDRRLSEIPLAHPEPSSIGAEIPPAAASFADLFDAACAGAPDRPALLFQGHATNYRTLDRDANRLAHALRAEGAGRGCHVAVFIDRDRGPELIVAVLAILKSDAAFVVLDPRQPAARHGMILEDAAPALVLTAGEAPPSGPWRALDFAELKQRASTLPATTPVRSVGPDDAAYLVFTSGSTGRPKGVVATHRGVGNLAAAQRAQFGLGPHDRVLQFSAVTFDAFVWDIVMSWGAGATLVLGTVEQLAPGDGLAGLLRDSVATALTIPPSALASLPRADLPALRLLVTAGEPCPAALVDRWSSGRRMVNAYGPTEATIWASLGETSPGLQPSIGHAIAGGALHLLDDGMSPVPVGAVGEICIGGRGVTRGYVNAPHLTASGFVPDPFANRPGARLYRSGDLGCWLPDGRLRYLGRRDDQIKIRGFRIEPGEIARALERLPMIARAHVGTVERPAGGTALVAWIEQRKDETLDLTELRAAVADRLPSYMWPASYVPVPAFPANAHGKIDPKLLPPPDWEAQEAAATPPQGRVEEALARVWGEVLGRASIGRNDDFFALGGDSILAVQANARLRAAGWILKLTDLFAAPVLSDLAARVTAAPAAAEMPSSRETWPLTSSQAGMLFHHLRAPALGLYVQRFDLVITGALDTAAFQAAWSWLIDRHEGLRTHVRWSEGDPVLAFLAQSPLHFIAPDWRGLDGAAQDAAAHAALAPLDPEQAPLIRFMLARIAPNAWRFVLAIHHLIADGWSLSILFDEWREAYRAIRDGRRPDVPPAPRYRSYLHWLATRDQTAARQFWSNALAGVERPTRLAAIGGGGGSGWSTATAELDEGATARLSALAAQHSITLNTVIQAAWARVTQIWTGDSDVMSGMVVAGRPAEIDRIERMVGLFVNTVPCRLIVPMTGSVRDWLVRVQEHLAAVQEHGHLQLAELQRLIGLDPDALPFDALVAVQNFPGETGHDDDLEVVARPEPARTDYPLTLLVEVGRRLRIRAVADHRYLEPETAGRLADALAVALTRLPEVIDRPIGAWPILADAEAADAIGAATGLRVPLDTARMLPDLIAEVAERHGDRPALIAGEVTWSYAQLLREADRLAAWLATRGVGPECTVALLGDRSLALTAATLGIWRAGAAFLPLGTDQPIARLKAMVARVKPRLIIAARRYADIAQALGREVALIDDPPWANQPPAAPGKPMHPASAAYVIFTSGSTGEPKGVVTSHLSTLNRLLWGQRHRPIGSGDRMMQKTPYTFDVSVWEMFWPLLAGATSVLTRPGGHLDADYLAALTVRQRVTVMHFVPSMLRLFWEDPTRGASLRDLKYIICSGEALPGTLRDTIHSLNGPELLNYYGPTEAAMEVGHYAAVPGETDVAVPLGRPIDNARLYIVDRDFIPCPAGVAGELLIGGIALARGYIGRPDLTAERFVPDPFSSIPGERVYRTGDLARRRADGVIEFLGRLDWQVKIRGQRIEPEEIAAALKRLPGIAEAVVLYQEDTNGDGRLIAYLVGKHLEPAELRRQLAAALPDAMIPSLFIFVAALPIGPTGKLDRAALPAPSARPDVRRRRPPGTALEWLLAADWRAVLGRDDVQADDHFLIDLGGHSLDALRLIGRLARRWPETISLADFLRAPTIVGVARLLRERTAPSGCAVPLVPSGEAAPIVFVHPLIGTVLCFIELARILAANAPPVRAPVWALEAPGFDGRTAAIATVEQLAGRHLQDLRIQLGGQAPVLVGYSFGGLVAFELARQLAAQGTPAAHLVILDTPAPATAVSAGRVPEDLDLLIEIVQLLERYDNRPQSITRAELAALPPLARAKTAREALVRADVLGGAVASLDFAAIVTVVRAHQVARSAYRPQSYAGAATILRAADPTKEDIAGLDPALLADPAFGWKRLITGPIRTITVPGDHVSLVVPPAAAAVAAALTQVACASDLNA
jgi:amino acid adenylation domain-containing protein